MATEADTWWSQQYASFSIRDLEKVPVFGKFAAAHHPYRRESGGSVEQYSSNAGVDEYRWEDATTGHHEILSHTRPTETWGYEHRYSDGESIVLVQSCTSPKAEWGEITRTSPGFELHEVWKISGHTKHFERFSVLNGGEKRGIKTGTLPAQDGLEVWTETYWEKPGESEFEKVWERPGASGGQNKHSKAEYWWGENWTRAGDHVERRVWHTHGDRDWGHVHGETEGKSWDEKWDISNEKREEEKITRDNGRISGVRLTRAGKDWHRQEWDGLAVLGEDHGHSDNSELRQALHEVFTLLHGSLEKSQHTLELLLPAAQQFNSEYSELTASLATLPQPNSQDMTTLLQALKSDRGFADKQERLKQRMITEVIAEQGKYAGLTEELRKTAKGAVEGLSEEGAVMKEWENRLENIKEKHASPFNLSLLYLSLLQDLEQTKLAYLSRLQSDFSHISSLLYRSFLTSDALSLSLSELLGDSGLKQRVDSREARLEEIWTPGKTEVRRAIEGAELALEGQNVLLQAFGSLRGCSPAEISAQDSALISAYELTQSHPSLQSARSLYLPSFPSKPSPLHQLSDYLDRLRVGLGKLSEEAEEERTAEQLKCGRKDEGIPRKLADKGEKIVEMVDKLVSKTEAFQALYE